MYTVYDYFGVVLVVSSFIWWGGNCSYFHINTLASHLGLLYGLLRCQLCVREAQQNRYHTSRFGVKCILAYAIYLLFVMSLTVCLKLAFVFKVVERRSCFGHRISVWTDSVYEQQKHHFQQIRHTSEVWQLAATWPASAQFAIFIIGTPDGDPRVFFLTTWNTM